MCLGSRNTTIYTESQDMHKSYRFTRSKKGINKTKRREQRAVYKTRNIEETLQVDKSPRYTLRPNSNIKQHDRAKTKNVGLLRLDNIPDSYLYPLIEKIQIADQNKFVKEMHQVQATTENIECGISQSFSFNTDQYQMRGVQISEIPSEIQGQNEEKSVREIYRIDIIEEAKFEFDLNLELKNKHSEFCFQPCEVGYSPHRTNSIERRNTSTPKRENKQHNVSMAEFMDYIPPITREELIHLPHKRKSPVEIGVLRESVLAYGSRIEEDIQETQQGEFDSLTDNVLGEIPAKVHRSEVSYSWPPISDTSNCEELIIKFQRNNQTYIPSKREFRKEEMEFISKYEFRQHISKKLSEIWARSFALKNQIL